MFCLQLWPLPSWCFPFGSADVWFDWTWFHFLTQLDLTWSGFLKCYRVLPSFSGCWQVFSFELFFFYVALGPWLVPGVEESPPSGHSFVCACVCLLAPRVSVSMCVCVCVSVWVCDGDARFRVVDVVVVVQDYVGWLRLVRRRPPTSLIGRSDPSRDFCVISAALESLAVARITRPDFHRHFFTSMSFCVVGFLNAGLPIKNHCNPGQ